MSFQLNVEISDECYAAIKKSAKDDGVFLRTWLERACFGYLAVREQAADRLREMDKIRASMGIPKPGEISGARLSHQFFEGATGGKDDRLPKKPKKLSVGKRRTDGPPRPARPGQPPTPVRHPQASAPVRPKINVSELLP
jgi:hypothetical protein